VARKASDYLFENGSKNPKACIIAGHEKILSLRGTEKF
jgi:hypothetical protein